MIKTIFVGDKPSPRMKKGAKAFDGAVCQKRLMAWINEISAHPCALFNRHDMELIGYVTIDMARCYYNGSPPCFKYIALGNKASEYLTKLDVPHFKLPHPSGRNRKLNDKKFIKEQLKLAKEYINET